MKMLACAAAAMAAFLSCAPVRAELNSCTEITALPFTITAQGVYCLKKNLNVNLASGYAITINAGNVTIDFNGFRVNNQAPLATNTAYGVFAQDRKNITLRNGFIRGFYRGVYIVETTTDASANHLVEGMKVADSGHVGIEVDGDKSVVRDNRVLDTGGGFFNTAFGIVFQVADDGLLAGNIVSGVVETYANFGVSVSNSVRVRLSNNEVTGINGGTANLAISFFEVNQAIIDGNKLLNDPGAGTAGIFNDGGSSNVACRENESAGFSATPFSGCDVPVDNVSYFN